MADRLRAAQRAEAGVARITPETVARFGAAVAGALTLHSAWTAWSLGKIHIYHEIAAMDLALYALGFGLLWLALVSAPRWRRWSGPLILAAVLFTTFAATYVSTRGVYGTDGIAFEHYAAKLALRGLDPYTVSMRPAFREFQVPLRSSTLLPDGRMMDRLSWPAGSFLILAPFVALGISDLRWIVLLFYLAGIAVVYGAAPRHLRPLVLLPVLGAPELADLTGSGGMDALWVLPLLLLIVWQRRPVLAGLCYGAACAIKQEPWILAPFLLVYYLRDGDGGSTIGRRFVDLAMFALPATALFAAFNGPFIFHDPRSWALGTLEPAIGNLVPSGPVGAVPGGASVLAPAAITALLVVYYALYFDRLRDAIWVIPMVITWYMPRGLHDYFVFWIPAAVLALALRVKTITEDTRRDPGEAVKPVRSRSEVAVASASS